MLNVATYKITLNILCGLGGQPGSEIYLFFKSSSDHCILPARISITPFALVGFGSIATIPPEHAHAPRDTTTAAFAAAALKESTAVLPPI